MGNWGSLAAQPFLKLWEEGQRLGVVAAGILPPRDQPRSLHAPPPSIFLSWVGGCSTLRRRGSAPTVETAGEEEGAITRLALECLWERFRFQKYPRTLSRNTWGKQCWRWPAHT